MIYRGPLARRCAGSGFPSLGPQGSGPAAAGARKESFLSTATSLGHPEDQPLRLHGGVSRRVLGFQPKILSINGLGAAPRKKIKNRGEEKGPCGQSGGKEQCVQDTDDLPGFPNVRIGQQGPGFFMREEPLPDSSLPSRPDKPPYPYFQ